MDAQRIRVLVKNNIIKLIRTPANLFMNILFPAVLTLVFGISFNDPETGMTISFTTPGLISYAIIFIIMTVAMSFTEDRESGILKRINTTQTTSSEFMGSHIISNMITSFIQVIIVVGLALLIGFRPTGNLWSYVLVFIIIGLFALIAVGLGLIVATIAKSPGAASGISFIFILPMMFFGTFMPLNSTTEIIAKFMPSAYATNALEVLFTGDNLNPVVLSGILFLSITSIIIVLIGVLLFNKLGNK
ncbi:ABC transporter permease [Promethearchaeum syntrophicum]|uniref:ABC transporter permease n=1 Tax=Promethearchaeum syntrophicum TaxID=2594042 RepID=A0A5B9DFA0_9ARCH|nr:ABC transporter permease [Candidatus Prometheoarchaeum syntrophicum]QEE17377.1 ABC-2 type transporter [Candidatus Prometheoarchaeum syntrophicum]